MSSAFPLFKEFVPAQAQDPRICRKVDPSRFRLFVDLSSSMFIKKPKSCNREGSFCQCVRHFLAASSSQTKEVHPLLIDTRLHAQMGSEALDSLNDLRAVSPLLPRSSPRFANASFPNQSCVPTFTAAALNRSVTLIMSQVAQDNALRRGTPTWPTTIAKQPPRYHLEKRRRNTATISWDPDDFQGPRKSTWAPLAPRRVIRPDPMPLTKMKKETSTGARSEKRSRGVVGETKSFKYSSSTSKQSGRTSVLGASPGMEGEVTANVHTRSGAYSDPLHKRDVVITHTAFGWMKRP